MEINREDIIRLILQFCQENGFSTTLEVLQNESKTSLNLLDSKQGLAQNIHEGKWDKVLLQIKNFHLKTETLLDLYELIICELVEVNETKVAHQFYQSFVVNNFNDEKERLLRLDYLIRKPGKVELHEIYLDALDKKQRREQLSKKLIQECIEAPSSQLLELIQDALKFRQSNKMLNKNEQFQIFRNSQVPEHSDTTISRINKVLKYSEQMRVNAVTNYQSNLITGSVDGTIEVWDTENYQICQNLEYQVNNQFMFHKHSIIDLSAQQDLLASLDIQGQTKIWKLKTGKCLKIIENTHQKLPSTILLGVDVSNLFIASDTIQLYGLKSGIVIKHYRGHSAQVLQILQSEEGSKLYTSSNDETIRVWDMHSSEQIQLFKCEGRPLKIVYNNKQLFVCLQQEIVILSTAFNVIQKIKTDKQFQSVCTSQNFIYGLSDKNIVYVYNQQGKGIKAYKLPGQQVNDVILCECVNKIFAYASSGELVFIGS